MADTKPKDKEDTTPPPAAPSQMEQNVNTAANRPDAPQVVQDTGPDAGRTPDGQKRLAEQQEAVSTKGSGTNDPGYNRQAERAVLVTDHQARATLAQQAMEEAATLDLDEAPEGPRYLVNGVIVDADGKPVDKRKAE